MLNYKYQACLRKCFVSKSSSGSLPLPAAVGRVLSSRSLWVQVCLCQVLAVVKDLVHGPGPDHSLLCACTSEACLLCAGRQLGEPFDLQVLVQLG